jgi:hypothetical protein
MFSGKSIDISMEEIYGVDFNSSIYQFTTQTWHSGANTMTTIEVILEHYLTGLDGTWSTPSGLLDLSLISSTQELCATFFILLDSSVKEYSIKLTMHAEPDSAVSMSGFMSLPNQARSLDRFRLFELYELLDKKYSEMYFSVTSLKYLQKRNTVAEPCIRVDNYDKVLHTYSYNSILPL